MFGKEVRWIQLLNKLQNKVNLKNIIKKHKIVLLLGLIIGGAFLIRIYNLPNWQYLQHDQGRDLIKISEVISGEREIPLLGPRASGENLFLGPAFYYFQIISAFIFGVSPLSLVLPDLFFSVCTIPLLYYFLRMFFTKKVSILTVSVFSFSFAFVQFGRFAWNPNSIPFWSLLLMTSILKIQQSLSEKQKGTWLILAAISFGIVSQLHFIALLGFPVSILLFWFFYHPVNIKVRYWCYSLSAFLLVNLPLVLNDTVFGGENWRQFFGALSSGVEEKRGFVENLLKFFEYASSNLTFFVSSLNSKELGILWIVALLIFIDAFCLAVLCWQRKYKKEVLFENVDDKGGSFLVLNMCWFLGFIPLYYKLAFDMDNLRFWFPIFVVPFLIIALYLRMFFHLGKTKAFFNYVGYLIIVILLVLNFSAIWKWYGSLSNQKEIDVMGRSWTSCSFKQDSLETVQSQRAIAKHIVQDAKNQQTGICLNTPSEFTTVYKYLILKENEFKGFFKKKGVDNEKAFNQNKDVCRVYVIDKTSKTNEAILRKMEGNFSLNNKKTEGTFSTWIVTGK